MKTITQKSSNRTTDHYLELIREFPLKAIRTKTQYQHATRTASHLALHGERNLSTGQRDYLDALMILIEAYDLAQQPWQKTSGLELLNHLVEQNNMSLNDLGKIVGSRPLASLILLGKRDLSKEVMRRLGNHFKVDPAVFM